MKVTPIRMDIVTRKKYPKDILLRFVYQNGSLRFERGENRSGRGVYIHPTSFEDPRLEKAFSRAFKSNISKKMIEEAYHG